MTKEQYEFQSRILMRERELQLVDQARKSAEPRYVKDAIAFLWRQVFLRKVASYDSQPVSERRRIDVLIALERNEPMPEWATA